MKEEVSQSFEARRSVRIKEKHKFVDFARSFPDDSLDVFLKSNILVNQHPAGAGNISSDELPHESRIIKFMDCQMLRMIFKNGLAIHHAARVVYILIANVPKWKATHASSHLLNNLLNIR